MLESMAGKPEKEMLTFGSRPVTAEKTIDNSLCEMGQITADRKSALGYEQLDLIVIKQQN